MATVSLPEELQAALDERISAGMKGGMSADKMAGYTKFQVAQSIPLAAGNEGGRAGIGAGLGAGLSVGQVMGQAMGQALNPAAAPAPAAAAAPAAPAAPAEESIEDRLGKLKGLLDQGLISPADSDATQAELLKKLIG